MIVVMMKIVCDKTLIILELILAGMCVCVIAKLKKCYVVSSKIALKYSNYSIFTKNVPNMSPQLTSSLGKKCF